MPSPVIAMVQWDQSNIEVIIISSPIRFGKGGSAKLAKLVINHHAVIRGRIICRPRANTIVRLWVRS